MTNQRETTILWDKTTGKVLHNALVWLDARTEETVDFLLQQYNKGRDCLQVRVQCYLICSSNRLNEYSFYSLSRRMNVVFLFRPISLP